MANATRFDEIVFMDDFFRSSDNSLPSHPANRRFLHKAFRHSASRLGIVCREEYARSDGGRLDVAAMMKALGLAPTPAGWAKASAADLTPVAEMGLMPMLTPRTLVIGWGLTPSLMHFIERSGAAFVDLEISPIRFTSHLAFCARTNDRQIEAALGGWHIDEELFWNEAIVLEGYFSRRGPSLLFDRDMTVGLFCGQTAVDLALIRDGEIAHPIDGLDEIRELASSVDLLLIKPHPYESDLRHLTRLASQISNVAWTDSNIYALMCADNLSFVCGLSSGALREAAYFMKPAVPLIEADRNRRNKLPAACSDWQITEPGILSMQALSKICGRTDGLTQRPARFPDDALDRAFAVRWGWDAQSPGLHAAPELAPGRVYDFQAGQPATAWLSFGWSAPEGTGVWTGGTRACLVIPLASSAPANATELRARIEGLLFVGTSSRNPIVRAWIGGRQADVQTAGGTTGETEVRFVLKAPSTDMPKARVLVLEFDITDPLRPCDCGLGADARRLGFHLQRLSLEWLCVSAEAVAPDVESPATPLHTPAARPVRHAVQVVIAAAVCVGALVASLPPTRAEEPAQSSVSASRWHRLQHTLAMGLGVIRDDIHTLLHHG
ncbi:hypothetical protein QTH89_19030 [Variovorax sp. J22G21]|uniref:hypothetical protein n=1 Tax=Variovorax fucosicus TaxID=3053517 RepID=UPI00257508A6|nr:MULTISPECIES: hypothetical protein [unclassified Variovorax]MDM0038533.1 hypothetical protein [Variovorax sp. J22R193]MDM0063309.1 hypothetical protein [Variovorax sp. J22G21]